MTTVVAVNSVQTADGFQLIPLSLSVYFRGSVHAEVFPQAIVR